MTRSSRLAIALALTALTACSTGASDGSSGDDDERSAGESDSGAPGIAAPDGGTIPDGGGDTESDVGTTDSGVTTSGDAAADSGSSADSGTTVVSGAPSAVGDLQETGQGAGSTSLAWTAATPGKAAIAHYKIYRDGVAIGTTSGTTYNDTTATGATAEGYAPDHPATSYAYDVSAVDADGDEGPLAAKMTAWMYNNGTAFWGGADYDGDSISANYSDTTGAPENGGKDIAITVNGSEKWWQPYSGAPFLTTDPAVWAMELGGFHYLTIDLKPTKPNQTWQINVISRNPPGDTFNSAQVILPGNFGPAPEVGEWATYKIPFLPASGFADGSSLEVGYGKFTGSISGSTLTVTGNVSGMNVQASSWLTGPGIAPNTWITGPAQARGGPGTYQVSPSQNVASTTITAQRTNMYKIGFIDMTSYTSNLYYVDKVGFTAN